MRRGDLSSSSERVKDGQACWRCRASRTGCDTEDPCQQCRNSPAPSAIPCERGLVCEVIGQGAICHLPPKSSSPRDVPPALDSAGRCINDSRWRQQETVDRLRGYCSDPASSPSAGPDTDSVLFKVVSAGIHNAQKIQPLHELGITFSNDTHREPIINIMWELEDNPDAARLLGIGSVVDLAALLETASLCEITHGRSNNKMPIVYTALQCLRYCLEGIRLSVGGVLPTAAGAPVDEIHAHCAQRNECIVPGLRKLSRYAPRYVKALTTELFSRDNARFDNWLLVFYSLCIQAYVRRGLMLLEGEGGKRQSPMPGARQYLQTAVLLFGHISVRGKGTLAKKIRGARAKPSAYAHLNLAPHPTRPGGGGSWEIWHEEGFIEYLERVFELPRDMCQSRSSPEQHGSAAVAAAGTLLASDSSHDNWDMMGAPSQMQMETEMVASHGGSDSLFASSMDCWNPSRPPSNISVPSFASMTTTGQGGYSLAPNSRGLMTPSMLSFSTGTVDDQSMTDGNFDFDFGYGTSGNY
ncbi:hypothetical protein QBC34DRAFT_412700 [Podospora aff. communis PSN243]|uniref:Zn(2)-C6 fungal-type domain-containing protein n=1 Tax=Podospora aff. communis PSN243 TaxID=3040156 RepID=A0AAV9GCI8_9PEZI|nr:hypothetical protein QBC34DRAFT_412700 [Podospora aff. communis PSN243]